MRDAVAGGQAACARCWADADVCGGSARRTEANERTARRHALSGRSARRRPPPEPLCGVRGAARPHLPETKVKEVLVFSLHKDPVVARTVLQFDPVESEPDHRQFAVKGLLLLGNADSSHRVVRIMREPLGMATRAAVSLT
ncbi:uncharacterized protein LOC126355411 [Schistocerca gregaria]|uniref:uncharacterized protein LOC126355411 n=1 Tax=Schistocerca gregaria TaxID=7010 RepID=UPI00211F41D7|nr:uncharacterized protein LOC126355411 [Schistocerca gregaria]